MDTKYNSTNYVYFFHSGRLKLIKIGRTWNVDKRLNMIRLQGPDKDLYLLGYIEGSYGQCNGIEYYFHKLFKDHHSHGEWYRDDQVKDFALQFNDGNHFFQVPAYARRCNEVV